MKTILVTKKSHYKYNYIAHWIIDGIPFYSWFVSKKDINDYFSVWTGYKIVEV